MFSRPASSRESSAAAFDERAGHGAALRSGVAASTAGVPLTDGQLTGDDAAARFCVGMFDGAELHRGIALSLPKMTHLRHWAALKKVHDLTRSAEWFAQAAMS